MEIKKLKNNFDSLPYSGAGVNIKLNCDESHGRNDFVIIWTDDLA